MLALVKKPHIEISLQGEHVGELVDWIKKKYDVAVLFEEPVDDFASIESTEYWKEMEKNRIGNLLAGARLKAGLTQALPDSRLCSSFSRISRWPNSSCDSRMNMSLPEGTLVSRANLR